jgi:D-glycero-D-manno-heptose 1,7-bisphosphate phosphatase
VAVRTDRPQPVEAEERTASAPVLFLDKDGTLIEDLPYNVDPGRVRFAPGARDAIRQLAAAGFRFAVVTNQSGVARGYFSEADLSRLHQHLGGMLDELGADLAGFYVCPHLPTGVNEYAIVCDCRKPAPGLLQRAARELGVELRDSWFIGDTWMDVAAGRQAGCRTILVGPEHHLGRILPPGRRPDHAVPDLTGAARIILAEGRRDRRAAAERQLAGALS